jgi:pyrimidine-nucleoside phosphorylase
MRAVDIIAKKRDGLELSPEEIHWFIQSYVKEEIPDYQTAALLMAIYLRGMNTQETIALTMAMAHSGEMLSFKDILPFTVDKHSTGGVGDKTTLALTPAVSALGLPVAKMSGRALGHTGGTLDKLESIPGFRSDLTPEEFRRQAREIGLVVASQTAQLAPADGKLYALRDATATVGSLPLISSSIMSKKLAGGADAILLDVKVGHGSFMKTLAEAVTLAGLMVDIGRSQGRRMAAVLTDMHQPLGRAVGNALELREALETLHGAGPEDFRTLVITLAGHMLTLAGITSAVAEGQEKAAQVLANGAALRKFRQFIVAQGGDPAYVDEPDRLPKAQYIETVPAPRDCYIAELNAMEVGLTSALLGAGRAKKGDPVDHAVGIILHAKIGDRVTAGSPLFTIHASHPEHIAMARERMLAAYAWSDEPVTPPPLIYRAIM